MLNLLQSSVCGNESVSVANGNNNTHFLSKNLQRNGNLRSENFEENIKIEQITSGDQIAFIKIRDQVPLPPIVKPQYDRRTQFQKLFLQSYPDFFLQYCLCIHKKVEPDDPNSVSGLANGEHNDKYGANSFLLNHTQIIPITVHPTKYEYVILSSFHIIMSLEMIIIIIIPNNFVELA